uniref:Transducin/WD40 repeat-like superfamily protein n=1 Tax=Chenopodium quinoa TaxID=63459 RepID=A0A803NAS8_CHEQI
MSHLHIDDADYMAEEYEIEDFDDDMDEDFRDREMGGSDSEIEEYDFMENKFADTSSAQARRGRDIQGIPWERLSITREKYRQTRIEQYKNYENIPNSGEGTEKLRNLVWATSKHDVYLMSNSCIVHWSSLARCKSEVLNVSGHVAPTEKHPGSILEGFSQTQVSTLSVKDNLLVAGGFQGELICKNLDRSGVSFCTRTTYDDNANTNAVEIYASPSGAIHFTASNNDSGVRDFDLEKFQLSKHFQFPWPVNVSQPFNLPFQLSWESLASLTC